MLKSAKRLAALPPGARLEIIADDPLAALDLPLFCRQEGQRLIDQGRRDDLSAWFLVERGDDAPALGRI